MTRIRISMLLASGAVIVVATAPMVAVAHDRSWKMDMSFEMLDTNADGSISKDEIESFRQQRFADADANGDGGIDAEELAAAMMRWREVKGKDSEADKTARIIERLDDDGDGKLSFDEWPARRSDRLFRRADDDDNGLISKEEFDSMSDRKGRDKGHKRGRHRDWDDDHDDKTDN